MVRRILAVVALLAAMPGCGRDGSEPARQAANEQEGSLRSEQRAPLPPPARTEVVGSRFFYGVAVVGGLTADGKASAQADHYSFPEDTWRSLPALPIALHHAGAGELDQRLYVVGGYTTVGAAWVPVAEVWSLGIEDKAWRKEPPLSVPRGALAVASLPNALVAVGGVAGPDLVRTEILERGATGWRRGPDLTTPREHLAATYFEGRVYAIGGRAGTLESNRDSVESWAPGEQAWRAEPKLNRSRGGIGAATVRQGGKDFGYSGGVPCVAGGEEPGDRTVAEVECLVRGAWKVVARLAFPRHGLAVAAPGDQLHVIGGGPKPGLHVSDVHEMFYL
jgi:hypothetical protein